MQPFGIYRDVRGGEIAVASLNPVTVRFEPNCGPVRRCGWVRLRRIAPARDRRRT